MSAPYADIYCTYCFSGYHEEGGCPMKEYDRERGADTTPYPRFCRKPELCAGKSSCQSEMSCVD